MVAVSPPLVLRCSSGRAHVGFLTLVHLHRQRPDQAQARRGIGEDAHYQRSSLDLFTILFSDRQDVDRRLENSLSFRRSTDCLHTGGPRRRFGNGRTWRLLHRCPALHNFSFAADRGNNNFDVRHCFNMTALYELPSAKEDATAAPWAPWLMVCLGPGSLAALRTRALVSRLRC